MNNNTMQLKSTRILSIPLKKYCEDFTFLVNGEKFKTNRLISDLLSPKICEIHELDPTFDTFIINTYNKGHFTYILDLVNFNTLSIPDNEMPFISEIIQLFNNDSINMTSSMKSIEITEDNVINLIQEHEKNEFFYSKLYESEIDYISSHFSTLCQEYKEELSQLRYETIKKIISHPNLLLKSENQLLSFLNELCLNKKDSIYSNLYEYVLFSNVENESMKEFLEVFDYNEITNEIWKSISDRLVQKIECHSKLNKNRYIINGISFSYEEEKQFSGILHYLFNQTNGKIESIVNITSSSQQIGDSQPKNVVFHENNSKRFHSANVEGSWICFDFKDHSIIPKSYTLKSCKNEQNGCHPKSWVIEGSNNYSEWKVIDKRNNNADLNGFNLVHNFQIENTKSEDFRYIRMRMTGPNWHDSNFLIIYAFEFYGEYI